MPEQLIPLRRGEAIFNQDGQGTRRFNEYIEALTSTVVQNDASSEEVSEVAGQVNKVSGDLEEVKLLLRSLEEQIPVINNQDIHDRLNQLECAVGRVVDLSIILKRLDDIEAQL